MGKYYVEATIKVKVEVEAESIADAAQLVINDKIKSHCSMNDFVVIDVKYLKDYNIYSSEGLTLKD